MLSAMTSVSADVVVAVRADTPRSFRWLRRLCVAWQTALFLSCASVAAKPYNFVIVPQPGHSSIVEALREGCSKAERELNGKVVCEVRAGGGMSPEIQVQLIEESISNGADGIAISPVDPKSIVSVLKKAEKVGIPALTFGADVAPEDRKARIAFIAEDNYKVGVDLARLALLIKPNGGTFCVQSGPSAPADSERLIAIQKTLGAAGGWSEIKGCPLRTSVDPNEAVKQMSDVLTTHPKLDAFISTNGAPQFAPDDYQKVLLPYKDKISTGAFAFTAGGVLPEQIDLLRKKLSSGQVGVNYFEIGYKIIYFLYDIKQGKGSPGDPTFVQPELVFLNSAARDAQCPPPQGTHQCGDGTCGTTCGGR